MINLDRIDDSTLSMIKEYEEETKGVEDREYFYVTQDMFDDWSRDLYECLEDDLAKAGNDITDSELRALVFWEVDFNHSGWRCLFMISILDIPMKRWLRYLEFPDLIMKDLSQEKMLLI